MKFPYALALLFSVTFAGTVTAQHPSSNQSSRTRTELPSGGSMTGDAMVKRAAHSGPASRTGRKHHTNFTSQPGFSGNGSSASQTGPSRYDSRRARSAAAASGGITQ